jgi:heparan-alpha-glucosaminide N-acetyltransferase
MTRWTIAFKPAGENSLTTYLAPDIIYYLSWMSGINIFFYKINGMPFVPILGSLAWAFLMAGLTALLVKINVRLRL